MKGVGSRSPAVSPPNVATLIGCVGVHTRYATSLHQTMRDPARLADPLQVFLLWQRTKFIGLYAVLCGCIFDL